MEYTPTYRGFGTFLGYYAAALGDYWYHKGGAHCNGAAANFTARYPTDLSNSTTGAPPKGASTELTNGTYNSLLFTQRAVETIGGCSSGDRPCFVYLAFQNVHSTAQSTANGLMGTHPIQAPCKTIETHYATTVLDTYKAHGGAITELDTGVGAVLAALEAAGRLYALVFVSDNGGPLPHSTNGPLRGGKHTMWEVRRSLCTKSSLRSSPLRCSQGGVNVRSFVTGSLIPAARRGSKWTGMAHSSDWYLTIAEGMVGVTVGATGPRKLDGFNLWPSLLSGGDSPRNEVIHQINNNFSATPGTNSPDTIRVGKYKYIGGDPGDARIIPWPEPAGTAVLFGLTNGSKDGYPIEEGSGEHCRAPVIKGPAPPKTCAGGCLFDLSADKSESNNLINDTSLASVVARLKARLAQAAAEAGPWAFPFNKTTTDMLDLAICEEEARTNYEEPMIKHQPVDPPPPPPPPLPPCGTCEHCIEKACEDGQFAKTVAGYNKCLACTSRVPCTHKFPGPGQARRWCHKITDTPDSE
jgi:hypothetical protein